MAETFTSRLTALECRIRDLEEALRHQRQLTAAAEMRCRALETTQGLAWRAAIHGRRASEPAPATPIKTSPGG